MHAIRVGIVLVLCLIATACGGPGAKQMVGAILPSTSPATSAAPLQAICPSGDKKDLFFAAPVCTGFQLQPDGPIITATMADADNNPAERVGYISAVLVDSRQKCQDFIKQFTGEQAGQNSLLDVSALLLSGIGAAITGPASTIRGLAAGSTALQGVKQTINSNFYQQLTIALFIQQINTTYFTALDNQFVPASLSGMTAAGALAGIQSIHRQCSIPFAAANLNAGPQKPQPAAGTTSFLINGPAASGDVLTLALSSTTLNLSTPLVATAAAGNSATNLALQLEQKVIATGVLSQAGVIITVTQPSTTSAKLSIQGGPADIKWTLTAGQGDKVTVTPSS